MSDANGEPAVVTFEASTDEEVFEEVARLNETVAVVAVEQDQPVRALATVTPGDDSLYSGQYGFAVGFADFETAWNVNNFNGSGVRIAIVDTGVQADHPDLGPSQVVAGKDFVTSDAVSDFARKDGNGHGTHVAGTAIAADNTIGVVGGAPGAKVVPVRVLDCVGTGSFSSVASGVLWASDSLANGGGGAQVINLSLGGDSDSSVLHDAIITAVNRGVVVVAAAGNDGNGANSTSFPGAYAEVVAVGAVGSTGSKASYSNNNSYIDVAAAGTNVTSTLSNGAYGSKAGTSMATPHVSAIAALMKQRCGSGYLPGQVRARLIATAGPAIPGFAGTVGLAKAGSATAAC